MRDRDGAPLCVAEAGGVPRAAAARPPGHRQPPPHRLDHPRTQTQLSRWTQSSCQALEFPLILSLRTETKQKYVYRLGLDNKKYLYIYVGLGSVETVTNGTRISGTALVMDNLVASTITASAQAASLELAADKEVSGGQVFIDVKQRCCVNWIR